MSQNKFRNKYLHNSDNRVCDFINFLPKNSKNLTAIEFGPGSGRTLIGLLRLFPKAKLYGFDNKPAKLKSIKIFKVDLDTFPILRFSQLFKKTDIFIFLDVLEHLYSPETFLSSVYINSNKGSLFIISCPNFASIRMLNAWLFGEIPKNDFGFFDKTHLHWFSVNSFSHFFKQESCSSVVCEYIFSKNKFYASLQKLLPNRLCSQFILIAKK